jgi:hypothetical protein
VDVGVQLWKEQGRRDEGVGVGVGVEDLLILAEGGV